MARWITWSWSGQTWRSSSFGGIGSEPYKAIQMGRKAIACELKSSNFAQMVKNCENATRHLTGELFQGAS
jgi:hypothetical protein